MTNAKTYPLTIQLSDAGISPLTETTVLDPYNVRKTRALAIERPLTIYVDRHEIVTLMTLGTEPELLTLGYLYNQGVIDDISIIASIQVDWQAGAAAVTTHNRDFVPPQKLEKKTITTGCGQGSQFGNWLDDALKLRVNDVTVKQSTIYHLLDLIRQYNPVYRAAGSVHGCALCDENTVIHFTEDVGRHNAVDVIAGYLLLHDISADDKLFYTTGRLTSEMVIKIARMKIPTLFSRSGLTGLGVEIAEKTNVMLIARCRGKQFLVTTHHERFMMDTPLTNAGRDRSNI